MKNKYTINIICHQDGWILNKMGCILNEALSNSNLIYPNEYIKFEQQGLIDQKNTINYYMNYSLYRRRSNALDAAWFTHIEVDQRNERIKNLFIETASIVDLAIFQAPMYMELCQKITKSSCVIIPGVDDIYSCRLRLGISGRNYDYTTRKNPELLAFLMQIPWLKIEFTGGEMSDLDLPEFYQRQDFVLVLSKVEGGPMSVLEALAMGKEVIFPRGVGFGELFNEGLHYFELDNPESLIYLLKRLMHKKQSISKIVEQYTWSKFAENHQIKFDEMIKNFS